MKSLAALLRKQHDIAQLSSRAFANVAKDLASAESNPFLRYSNPYPASFDHTALLATLPTTKVRAGALSSSIASAACQAWRCSLRSAPYACCICSR